MLSKCRCLTTIVLGFVFVFAFQWLVHGHLLMPQYEATSALWRAPADMQAFFPYTIASQVLFVMGVAWLYCASKCQGSLKAGALYGIKVGFIVGAVQLASVAYMPIPVSLAVSWFVTAIVEGLGLGIVIALVSGSGCSKCE